MNDHYNHDNPLTSGTTARAEDVNADLDSIAVAFDEVQEIEVRCVKLPAGVIVDQAITENATNRANKVIGFDINGDLQLQPGVGSWKGDWTTTTAYAVRDVVRDPSSKNLYIAETTHTSGVLATDIAGGDLSLLINVADIETAKAAAEAAQSAAETAETNAAASEDATAADVTTTNSNVVTTGNNVTAAQAAQTAAEAAQTAAEIAFDNFDDRFLGSFAANPTLDNDGNALLVGALYYHTGVQELRVYTGSTWPSINALDAADVKALYEANADTNAFTDAEKTSVGTIGTKAPLSILYGGSVYVAGTTVQGNSGFTVSRPSTGTYILTHNLNNAHCGFSAIPDASLTDTNITCTYTANTITLYIRDAGVLTNGGWKFTLIDV